MVNESNNNFISSINSSANRSSRRRYAGSTNQSAANPEQTNVLRQRITSNRASFVSRTNPRSNSNTSKNELSATSSNLASEIQKTSSSNSVSSNESLSREEKLDKVLNLLEDITGEDISQNEISELIKGFKVNRSSKPEIINANNISEEVKPQDESKFAQFKLGNINRHQEGLKNLLEEWSSVEDDSGKARTEVAKIKDQSRLLVSAEKFWSNENDFWSNESETSYKVSDQDSVSQSYKDIAELQSRYNAALFGESTESAPKVLSELENEKFELNQYRLNPDNSYQGNKPYEGKINIGEEKAFSNFKGDLHNSQMSGLEDLREEWVSVKDSNSQAEAQIEQIDKQINLVGKAAKFWNNEEKFWDQIGQAGASLENEIEIDSLLSEVTGLENLMDQYFSDDSSEGESKRSSLENQMNTLKTQIRNLHSGF